MFRDEQGWIDVYKQKEALWIHDEIRPSGYHALLTSGLHSDGFFYSKPVTDDNKLLREAAIDLVDLFIDRGGNITNIDRVVGPQTGATRIAEYISYAIASLRGTPCEWSSPEKDQIGGSKRMVFNDPSKKPHRGEFVLLCEDVTSTGGSINLTEKAVELEGAVTLPIVLTLVNRSGHRQIKGMEFVSLIEKPMAMWLPEACTLCPASKPIKPKISQENWDLLTGKAQKHTPDKRRKADVFHGTVGGY